MAAVAQHGWALHYASERLQNDNAFRSTLKPDSARGAATKSQPSVGGPPASSSSLVIAPPSLVIAPPPFGGQGLSSRLPAGFAALSLAISHTISPPRSTSS